MRNVFLRRVTKEDTHMADLPSHLDSASSKGFDIHVKPDRRSIRSIPRWVKLFVIIFIILTLLFVILHLTGNGFGSHMHMSTIEAGVPQL
jgi:hypothetical protein